MAGDAPFDAFLVFLGVMGLVSILGSPWLEGVTRLLVAAGSGIAAAAWTFLRVGRAGRGGARGSGLEDDIRGGVAVVSTYRITDLIAVEELEDEGSQYYVLLADGRVVFLTGAYLTDAERAGRFPRAEVVVARAPRSGAVLELRSEGAHVPVGGRRPPFTTGDRVAGRVPEDGDEIHEPFDTLRWSRPD